MIDLHYPTELNANDSIDLFWSSPDTQWDLYRLVNYGPLEHLGLLSINHYDDIVLPGWIGVQYTLTEHNLNNSKISAYIPIYNNNLPPSPPSYINTPSVVVSGSQVAISWPNGYDPENRGLAYFVERSINNTPFVMCAGLQETYFSEQVQYWWVNKIRYRISSYDDGGRFSDYTYSADITIVDNAIYEKISGTITNYSSGWVKVDGILKKITDIWVKTNNTLYKVCNSNKATLSYYGTISPLQTGRSYLTSSVIGGYVAFAGGTNNGSPSGSTNLIEVYDIFDFTKYSLSGLATSRSHLASTTVSNYTLFGGGVWTDGVSSSVVDVYNNNLNKFSNLNLSLARYSLSATTIGDYAIFAGGYSEGYKATVDAFNSSLIRTIPTVLSVARSSLAATTVGDYALFGGGSTGSYSNVVDAYNTSLVRSTPTALSSGRGYLAATTIGNYALFGGGNSGTYSDVVDCYNTNLVRITLTPLTTPRDGLTATSAGNYALFAGGKNAGGATGAVDAYDTSLVKINPNNLSVARQLLTSTSAQNCLFFAGGYPNLATVDVYTIN